jgi:hypothetical protein
MALAVSNDAAIAAMNFVLSFTISPSPFVPPAEIVDGDVRQMKLLLKIGRNFRSERLFISRREVFACGSEPLKPRFSRDPQVASRSGVLVLEDRCDLLDLVSAYRRVRNGPRNVDRLEL